MVILWILYFGDLIKMSWSDNEHCGWGHKQGASYTSDGAALVGTCVPAPLNLRREEGEWKGKKRRRDGGSKYSSKRSCHWKFRIQHMRSKGETDKGSWWSGWGLVYHGKVPLNPFTSVELQVHTVSTVSPRQSEDWRKCRGLETEVGGSRTRRAPVWRQDIIPPPPPRATPSASNCCHESGNGGEGGEGAVWVIQSLWSIRETQGDKLLKSFSGYSSCSVGVGADDKDRSLEEVVPTRELPPASLHKGALSTDATMAVFSSS